MILQLSYKCLLGGLLLLGMAGCSKEPEEPAPGKGLQIALTASLPAGSGGTQAAADSREGIPAAKAGTKAVADPTAAMELYFARADQDAAGVYGAYGAAALKANRAAGTGARALTFDPAQYYQANGKSTKLAGWYPGGATAPNDATGKGYYDGTTKTVGWVIDGTQDILTASVQEGSMKSAALSFAFEHRLAQLQFYPYAEDAATQAAWGKILSIKVERQQMVAAFPLATAGATGALEFSGPASVAFTAQNLVAAQLPAGAAAATTRFGDPVMIAPQGEGYYLSVTVETELGGTVSALTPARAYAPGSVTRLKLKFLVRTFVVEPELSINDWTNDSFTYPYVQDGKYIVSQDLFGSSREPIHPDWTAAMMPDHNMTSPYNAVSAKFEVAHDDLSGTKNWPDAKSGCAGYSQAGSSAGDWRLPTLKELLAINAQKSTLTGITALTDNRYWSGTEYNNDDAWSVVGMGVSDPSQRNKNNSLFFIRCVRDFLPPVSADYPKVMNGKTILVMDDTGRADPTLWPIHPNWTSATMPVHNETSLYNAVAAQFEVAHDDLSGQMNWVDAKTGCAGYSQTGSSAGDWRLPTYKELQLIYAQKSALTGITAPTGYLYWADTENSSDSNYAWTVSMYGGSGSHVKIATNTNVRCVRDL